MDRQEAIRRLIEAQYSCERIESMFNQLDRQQLVAQRLQANIYKTSLLKVYLRTLWLIVAYLLIMAMFDPMLKTDILPATFLFFYLGATLYYYVKKTCRTLAYEEAIKKYNELSLSHQKSITTILNQNKDNFALLPSDYWYSLAIKTIIKYLREGRASSMPDALNLYDEQLHRWRMEDSLNQAEMYSHHYQNYYDHIERVLSLT